VLREEFPELDFELVVDGWDSKRGEWGADEVSLARRAAKMRKWLKDRKEDEIVVVTHGGTDPGGDVLIKVSCYTLFRRLEDLRILK
jgi:broad specificity phosphatase PhoE